MVWDSRQGVKHGQVGKLGAAAAGFILAAAAAGFVLAATAAAVMAADAGETAQPAVADGLARLDFREVIAAAKDRVFPTVVYIKSLRESHESGKKSSEEVSGSGVLITAAGEVLTNWHVVDKAVELRCLLYNGKAYDAELIGTDKDTDLGLLRLENPDGHSFPYAALGDSTILKEGDFVMAMGAPWGLSRSVSIGIISCTRRYLPENSEYSLWLQTDAAISPGNSGGPLVNTAGEVIGINTRGVMQGGDLGFAVPSETVAFIVKALREEGKVNWGWLGLQLQPLRDFERNIYFDGDQGVIVAETDPSSPARQAGLQPRDRILRVNGEPITVMVSEDLPALRQKLGRLDKQQPIALTVQRGGETLTLALQPAAKGSVEGEELDCPRWDLTVKSINRFDNPDLYFHRHEGVFVLGTKRPGNAAQAGISVKDIVLKIGEKEILTLDDVKEAHKQALAQVAAQPKIVFTVLRNGLLRQVVLDFSRDYERE